MGSDNKRQSKDGSATQEVRRRNLIDATLHVMAEEGLSRLTLAKVAAQAGLTAGSVNFHFDSKETLLLETLRFVVEEYASALEEAAEKQGADSAAALEAIIETCFSEQLCDAGKASVWYAFLSEARTRADYSDICGTREVALSGVVHRLFTELIASSPQSDERSAKALASAFLGLIDGLWQDFLFDEQKFDRAQAKHLCRAYLASVMPDVFSIPAAQKPVSLETAASPKDGLIYTLPSWAYRDEEYFALEKEHIFMRSWQVVCHEGEVTETGSYATFELLGERAFVIRGKDGHLRAFHNVCPHRAHAVVTGERGQCKSSIQCPYHGWNFNLDGTLKAVSSPETFSGIDKSQFGLKTIELEVWMGFVFIRFEPGGASVASRMAPFEAEFLNYRTSEMIPAGPVWDEVHPVDWKNAVENYAEDYHFPKGHEGLASLMSKEYDREVTDKAVLRLSHEMKETPPKQWSGARYHALLPKIDHLPEYSQRRWSYFGLFPNVFFDMFPESMDYFVMLPLGPGRMRLISRSFVLPEMSREANASLYLSTRINTTVQDEDNSLTRSVQQGLNSRAYSRGILSEKEIAVKGFQDWIRQVLPVTQLDKPPAAGTMARVNDRLTREGQQKFSVAAE